MSHHDLVNKFPLFLLFTVYLLGYLIHIFIFNDLLTLIQI